MLSKFRLGEQDVTSDFGIVLDKLQLLWQGPGIFAFDVEETSTSCTQQFH